MSLLNETFDAVPNGTAVSAGGGGNTSFGAITGSAASSALVGDTAVKKTGAASVKFTLSAASKRLEYTQAESVTVSVRIYYRPANNPSTNTTIIPVKRADKTTSVCFVVCNANGTVKLQNSSGVAIGTSTGTCPLNQWSRFELYVNNGNAELRLYLGDAACDNPAGSPSETISGAIAQTNVGYVAIGGDSSTTWTFNLDEARAEASGTIGPAVAPSVQTLVPISDDLTTGWIKVPGTAPSYAACVDESTLDVTDYDESSSNPAGLPIRWKLSAGITPAGRTGHTLYVTADIVSAGSGSLTVLLKEGTTVRATKTITGLTDTPTEYPLALSSAEASAITDYANLYVEPQATAA